MCIVFFCVSFVLENRGYFQAVGAANEGLAINVYTLI